MDDKKGGNKKFTLRGRKTESRRVGGFFLLTGQFISCVNDMKIISRKW